MFLVLPSCCWFAKLFLYCSCLPNSVLLFEGRSAVVRAVQHIPKGAEVVYASLICWSSGCSIKIERLHQGVMCCKSRDVFLIHRVIIYTLQLLNKYILKEKKKAYKKLLFKGFTSEESWILLHSL